MRALVIHAAKDLRLMRLLLDKSQSKSKPVEFAALTFTISTTAALARFA
jgi:hypothetical protein